MQEQSPAARAALGRKMGLTEAEYSGDLWKLQAIIDSTNLIYVQRIVKTRGYPGKSMVGEPTNLVAWSVLQHSENLGSYLPIIKKAGSEGEIPMHLVATMEDRYLMNEGKPQVYGTQARIHGNQMFIWPIEDPENVNERRREAGFESTIEEYSKELFGQDYVYRPVSMTEINLD